MTWLWAGIFAASTIGLVVLLAVEPVLGIELLPPALQEDTLPCGSPSASAIRTAERHMVLAAIRREGGNLSRAARSLASSTVTA